MQEKSQSAVLRIKESLSYKLGSTLIEYNKAKKANSMGGGISL